MMTAKNTKDANSTQNIQNIPNTKNIQSTQDLQSDKNNQSAPADQISDNFIKDLNPAQAEAVKCLGGPLLILAGAGSGKTKTLTHRIANLIAHGVPPERILAVTFTNKAANEMRARLWRLLENNQNHKTSSKDSENLKNPESSKNSESQVFLDPAKSLDPLDSLPPRSFMPYMGTFHSICVKILRREAPALNLAPSFVIYDMDDQNSLIRRILKSMNLSNNKSLKPKTIQNIISSEKNQGHTPEEYEASAYYPNQQTIAEVFKRYEKEKDSSGALDFDDLLLKTLQLFIKNPDIRQKWQNRFAHILIDEYQDTNSVQYHLIKLLVNESQNIAVVGDDWQSIYSWRGADFTNILNFNKDFPGAKVIKLEQNYRSTAAILNASQKIINKNKTRSEKTLYTTSGEGEPIEIEALPDDKSEASFVALKIINMKHDFPDLSDFAVLYRTNAQSYNFEKAFLEMNLPYKIVGGVRFYDRKEIKDLLAILKLAVNGRDMVSLERIMKNVLSGLGEVSIRKILSAALAIDSEKPLLDPDLPEVLTSAKAKSSLNTLINFLKDLPEGENPGETVKSAVKKFDFSTLTDDGTPASEERMKNLEVLASTAAEYDRLEDFVADAALMSSADENSEKNSITLMTLHAAKGLEFPVVFIVGMEEGLFPSGRGSETEADLEEERRLAYVGMTRAMLRLFLTYARRRNSYGSYSYSMPSRFLSELGYTDSSDSYSDDSDLRDTYSSPAGSLDFTDEDFLGDSYDPFPEDLPVWE